MTERPVRESTFGVSASHRVLGGAARPLVIFGVCAVAFAAAGYALYHGFATLERKIETLENNAKGSVDRLAPLTANLEEILKSQRRIEAAVARLEAGAPAIPQFESRPNLSALDLELLRSFFKLTRTADVTPKFKLGDEVPSSELKAMPEFVAEKISPELRGTRFLFDRNGSLVITAGPNNEVVVIVSA
jgi:hypothetical protein